MDGPSAEPASGWVLQVGRVVQVRQRVPHLVDEVRHREAPAPRPARHRRGGARGVTLLTALLPHTERAGTGAIAFVPLAAGLLTDKYLDGTIPPDSRAALRWGEEQARRRITPERLRIAGGLNEIARERGQTLAQLAIAWILRLPAITSVLVGVSRVEQLEENVRALAGPPFSPEELARIDALTQGG